MGIPLDKLSINDLGLSVRAEHCMYMLGIDKMKEGSVLELVSMNLRDLKKIRGCGTKTRNEIVSKLEEIGLYLNDKEIIEEFEGLKELFTKINNTFFIISKKIEALKEINK